MAGLEFWWYRSCSHTDLENLHLCLVVTKKGSLTVALCQSLSAPQVPDGMKEGEEHA